MQKGIHVELLNYIALRPRYLISFFFCSFGALAVFTAAVTSIDEGVG